MSFAVRPDASHLSRRSLLQHGAAGLAGAALLPSLRSLAQDTASDMPLAETTHGRIRGMRDEAGVLAFKGVPYAGVVSGKNRFKPAPPLQAWTGVRDATKLGPPSIQPPGGYFGLDEPAPAEDCLILNLWTPACDHRKRPVLFYCHGGGFTTGSGGAFFQDGANLARRYDVVVVETNHRLGLLGLLYLGELGGELGGEEYAGSGTQLLSDLQDGLRWVRDNIAQFGGDPGNVMVHGESGGGWKVSSLLAMPSAEKLFHKAAIESGPMLHGLPQDRAEATTRAVLKQLGLGPADWRRLLEVPAADLLKAQTAIEAMPKTGPAGVDLWPVLGGLLPHHPFDPAAAPSAKNKPLVLGTCRDEANFFLNQQRDLAAYSLTQATLMERLTKAYGDRAQAIYDAYRQSRPSDSPTDLYLAIETARLFGADTITLAERKLQQRGAPVYLYVFTHDCDLPVLGTTHKRGAYHSWDVVFRFDNLIPHGDGKPKSPLQQYVAEAIGPGPGPQQTANNLSALWTSFAHSSVPSAPGQPAWPAYTLPQRATMNIDAECQVLNDPQPLERQVWATVPRERRNPLGS